MYLKIRLKAIFFFCTTGLLLLGSLSARAQNIHEININVPEQKIYSGNLKLGGTNPEGQKISVNNYYISIDNKPFIPITGEFHFSRYPHQYWDESIKKMKANGINVISTYVFWNLHEEEEGKVVWSGDKNLREFIELCKKNNIYVLVRIGPFDHGEIRNGGLPDWLLAKPLNIRMNDPLYLSYVEKLYDQIGKQLNGLYYKDGGPIVGIQIENEYQHSAAPWGLTYPGQPLDFTAADRDLAATHEGVAVASAKNPYAELGNDHMKVLKQLAIKAGIVAPLYTATGWGYAAIIPNESIPVTAAYAYACWAPRDYSPFFLYKNMHADPDYSPVRYNPEDYPSMPAELGSGINELYSNRPVVDQHSFDALINRCLGSGANGVGYYMFHAGSTPRGIHNFMSDEAFGLPKISYEYQSPIGEYGQVREGYHRLKLLHFFLKDFGDLLAPMTVALPSNASSLKPENIRDLRYAVRFKGNSGFLFLNNFQDDTTMLDQHNIQVKVKTSNGDILIPEQHGVDLKSGENAIFPFNFNINGVHLNYATAQLLMKADGEKPYYVFFRPEGVKGEFSFEGNTKIDNIRGAVIDRNKKRAIVHCVDSVSEFVVSINKKATSILVITKKLALKAYEVDIKGEKRLMFSDAVVLQNDNNFELLSDNVNSFSISIYPKILEKPSVEIGKINNEHTNSVFSIFNISLPVYIPEIKTNTVSEKKLAVTLPDALQRDINDLYLNINYTGDTGMAFLDGQLVADNFYNGIPWQIGLRKFLANSSDNQQMVFYFRPMEKNAPYLEQLRPYPNLIPQFGNKTTFLKVNSISITPQYKTILKF